jgi:hypothetical protein
VPLRCHGRGAILSDRSVGRGLVELEVVAVGIFERCDATPGVLADFAGDLDAVAAELFDGLVKSTLGLEGDDSATVAVGDWVALRPMGSPLASSSA